MLAIAWANATPVIIGNLEYDIYGTSAGVTSGHSYNGNFMHNNLEYRENTYVIPPYITYEGNTYMVDKITDGCFDDGKVSNSTSSKYIKNIILPNTLKYIGTRAFRNTGLSKLIIPESVKSFSGDNHFQNCDLLTTLIYLSPKAPVGWTATTFTYVPDIVSYSSPSARINNANIIEMISFTDKSFTYNGEAPSTTWTNNVNGYTASLIMPPLEKEVGTYEVYIPVTFTKDSESFTTEVVYRYTIKPATLTVKVEDATRVYGDDNPTFKLKYSGFINGDSESVVTNAPVVTTTASVLSDVGSYPIHVSGGSATNYSLKYEDGTLFVTKAELVVSVDSATIIYGTKNPDFKLSFLGLKNNENKPKWDKSPTFSTTAEQDSDVGNYQVYVDCSAYNYTITQNNPGLLTIFPAPLNITANSTYRAYYEENPIFTFTIEGFVNEDNEASALQILPIISTSANKLSNAGHYEITVKEAQAKNYDITYTSGTLTINKRPLVAKVRNYERDYNADNPDFVVEYEGFMGADNENVLSTKPYAYSTANKSSNVGTYLIQVAGGESVNYDFSYVPGVLTINKAEQTLEWVQDLSNVPVGSQVELKAKASSGLPVQYTMEINNCASIYKAGKKTYIDCLAAGQILLKASQSGNENYYESPRATNALNIIGYTIIDPTLTIIQGEMGTIKTQVTKGSVHTFTIEAMSGWKIHSVSFNNVDVTKELDSNNRFTTANINENSTLNVVYESSIVGIQAAKKSYTKILGTSFGIRVQNAEINDILKVYTTNGEFIRSQRIVSPEMDIELPNNEIYVIAVGDVRVKVRL